MSLVKDSCTIIIVDSQKGHTKSIKLPSLLLNNWRYLVLVSTFVFVGGLVGCFYLYGSLKDHQLERSSLISRVNDLEQKIPKSSDTLNARTYVERIETKIQKINEYLKSRGVKGFSQDAVGGEEVKDLKLAPVEHYSMYDQYLERVFDGLTYTPTGFPIKAELTSNFGLRRNPFHGRSMEFHTGIDFRGARGDRVRSTAGGTVVHAGWNGGYGVCVRVKHKNGFETLYAHLSKVSVKVGEEIAAGHVVGEVGSTGRSSGDHLHYEVRRNGSSVNPVDFLSLE